MRRRIGPSIHVLRLCVPGRFFAREAHEQSFDRMKRRRALLNLINRTASKILVLPGGMACD